ncbi:hypothetical protein [Flavobacterium sp.]|uniref:hypothetical protein n=1 Tax=Flavobacterium sp. TaxID=239 RepID=UPI00286E96D9|nr:hypothetical protein [Flavobacterium sp.]
MKIKIIVATLLIGLIGLGYYFYYKNSKDKNLFENEEVFLTSEELTNSTQERELFIFEKDRGYLVKGKLLDLKFKEEYDKIPDTLAVLEFGDKLYSSENDPQEMVSVPCFSLFETKKTAKEIDASSEDYKFDNLKKYLKLTDSGKAEYPIESDGGFINQETYNEKYGTEFIYLSQKSIPYAIKQVLIKYLNENESENYTIAETDQRSISSLIQYGFFTQNKFNECAIVLRSKDPSEPNSAEKLLVFAYNRNQKVYLLYSKTFYSKIIIETKSNEDEKYNSQIYMDSEEKLLNGTPALLIKFKDKPNMALVYDDEFDQMTEYIQKPKSEIENSESEE